MEKDINYRRVGDEFNRLMLATNFMLKSLKMDSKVTLTNMLYSFCMVDRDYTTNILETLCGIDTYVLLDKIENKLFVADDIEFDRKKLKDSINVVMNCNVKQLVKYASKNSFYQIDYDVITMCELISSFAYTKDLQIGLPAFLQYILMNNTTNTYALLRRISGNKDLIVNENEFEYYTSFCKGTEEMGYEDTLNLIEHDDETKVKVNNIDFYEYIGRYARYIANDTECKETLEVCLKGNTNKKMMKAALKYIVDKKNYGDNDENDGIIIYNGKDVTEMVDKYNETDTPFLDSVSENVCNQLIFDNKALFIREDITEKLIETLGCLDKPNACLIGEAGVGKTSIIKGLAHKIIMEEVPDYLKDKRIMSLNMSKVVAGSKFRGEFEEKIVNLCDEVINDKDVILFIDEFHTIKCGNTSEDTSFVSVDIFKPYLSTGQIKMIGATTFKEYKKYIETDKALTRRFETIVVDEPNKCDTFNIISASKERYEKYHDVLITDEIIKSAIDYSCEYMKGFKLPDKAFNIIDKSSVHAKLNCENKKEHCEIKLTEDDIKYTVAKITNINNIDLDINKKRELVSNLKQTLHNRIVGQDEAVESVCRYIKRNEAGLKNGNRPIASFMFVGPTGVGKTELCKVLASEFIGNNSSLVRFDMSEYMEKHEVSKLIGAPPSYVGYGEGGQLTEAVKSNPKCVLLFDEVEKAHPDVFNILLQVLDDGVLTDSTGTKVDFSNTIIVMTSNIGFEFGKDTKKSTIGFGASGKELNLRVEKVDLCGNKLSKERKDVIESKFRPEFLNRIDKIIEFNSLTKEDSVKIAELLLSDLNNRMDRRNLKLVWSKDVIDYVVEKGFSFKYGARNLRRYIESNLEDSLSDYIIEKDASNGTISVNLSDTKFKFSFRKIADRKKSEKKILVSTV